MKKQDIIVGSFYHAKVGHQYTVVKVESISQETAQHAVERTGRAKRKLTLFHATNVKTGRAVTFRSAQRILRPSPPTTREALEQLDRVVRLNANPLSNYNSMKD